MRTQMSLLLKHTINSFYHNAKHNPKIETIREACDYSVFYKRRFIFISHHNTQMIT